MCNILSFSAAFIESHVFFAAVAKHNVNRMNKKKRLSFYMYVQKVSLCMYIPFHFLNVLYTEQTRTEKQCQAIT